MKMETHELVVIHTLNILLEFKQRKFCCPAMTVSHPKQVRITIFHFPPFNQHAVQW